MKFRNTKTGKVFEDIDAAIWTECGHREFCDESCPLYEQHRRMACRKYVISHPAEAARLMGFEVVEDRVGDATEMIKPRICEVLGVEVGEPFQVDGYKGEYHINEDGVLKWGGQTSDDAIYEIINHPDRIIRKPRFSQEEVEDAKALVRILGATGIERPGYGGNLCAVIGEAAKVVINQKLFPSLQPGQTARLEEVVM